MQSIDLLFRKIRFYRAFSSSAQIFILGFAGWLAWNIVGRIFEKYLFYEPVLSIIIISGILLFFLIGILVRWRNNSDRKIARELDWNFQLKDRVISYVEFRNVKHPFCSAIKAETEEQLSGISPLRASRPLRNTYSLTILILALVLIYISLPFLPVPKSIQDRQHDRKQIVEQAKQLQLTFQQLENQKQLSPELKKAIEEFEKQARELGKGDYEKTDALKKLNSMKEKLSEADRRMAQNQASKLGEALKNSGIATPVNQDSADGAGQNDELLRDLEKMISEDQANGDAEPGSSGSKQLSKEQEKKLQDAIDEYKKQKGDSEKTLAEMQKAMENAKKGMTKGKNSVTHNSKLTERDMERSKGGVEDGPGTTNQDVGPQSFDTKKQNTGKYVEDKTKAKYEQLYSGQREKVGEEPIFVDSQWNPEGDPKQMRIRSFGLDSASVDEDVTPGLAEQNQSESAVRKEKIPASYQKIVQKYLESIDKQ